jgi:putative SOS response-associated peptidase YedK
MCGRYYNKRKKQKIAEKLQASKVFADPLPPNYNIAPSTFQPIVRQERDSDEREMILARWGLVPFSARSLADFKGFSTFNAKAETLSSSPTWKAPLKSRRCLIPADGFYEWKVLDNSRKPKKQPYAISLTDGEPMAFAGLWDAWKEPKTSPQTVDTWLQSFSIITTEANELMSQVHTRMPVILRQRDWAEWLDRDGLRPPPLHLLRPYDSEAMQLSPCNSGVGNVKNNGPEMLVCPNPDEPLPLLNSL